MARRGPWRAAVAAVGVLAATGLPGCSPATTEVAVAGLDEAGTPVVAAERCGEADGPLAAIVVRDLGASGQPIIWQVEEALASPPSPTTAPPRELAPPPPVPAAVGPVTLVAIGAPAPWGWTVTTPLEGPLPARGRLRVEVHHFVLGSSPDDVLTIDLDGGEDRYAYVAGGGAGSDVGAAEVGRALFEGCDDTSTFDGGRLALAVGGGGVVLLVLALPVGVVTARQYRRAGEARARS